MRQVLLILVLAAVGISLAQAQEKPRPNLVGKWVVDFTKSEKTSNTLEDGEQWIIIEQREPEIRMMHKFESLTTTPASVFYTDGRDASYDSPGSKLAMKSKTRWDGDKLVIHFTGTVPSASATRNINVIHEYKLSKDGNTLTKKIIVVRPRSADSRLNAVPVPEANQEFRKVYNRAPAP